jgi:hypothetical protein
LAIDMLFNSNYLLRAYSCKPLVSNQLKKTWVGIGSWSLTKIETLMLNNFLSRLGLVRRIDMDKYD